LDLLIKDQASHNTRKKEQWKTQNILGQEPNGMNWTHDRATDTAN